jgi:hypothetical protein
MPQRDGRVAASRCWLVSRLERYLRAAAQVPVGHLLAAGVARRGMAVVAAVMTVVLLGTARIRWPIPRPEWPAPRR